MCNVREIDVKYTQAKFDLWPGTASWDVEMWAAVWANGEYYIASMVSEHHLYMCTQIHTKTSQPGS